MLNKHFLKVKILILNFSLGLLILFVSSGLNCEEYKSVCKSEASSLVSVSRGSSLLQSEVKLGVMAETKIFRGIISLAIFIILLTIFFSDIILQKNMYPVLVGIAFIFFPFHYAVYSLIFLMVPCSMFFCLLLIKQYQEKAGFVFYASSNWNKFKFLYSLGFGIVIYLFTVGLKAHPVPKLEVWSLIHGFLITSLYSFVYACFHSSTGGIAIHRSGNVYLHIIGFKFKKKDLSLRGFEFQENITINGHEYFRSH